ncbi:MAG: hypothetical protein AAFZ07_00990 [Actinomycetota bacterium]
MTERRSSRAPAAGLVLAGALAIVTASALDPAGLSESEQLAVTMLRTAVGLLGAHAILVGVLTLVASALGWMRGIRWAMRLGAARLGLAATIGAASLSAAALSTATPAGAVGADPAETAPVASLRPVPAPVATLTPLPAEESGDIDDAPTEQAEAGTWVVEQGDHLWAIAEAQVGPEADDLEVHDYWVRLVELNTDRLVVPDDPDLILPGQELLLPER